MDKAKLYRLMDVIDEIKQLDDLISIHNEHKSGGENNLMLEQYLVKKDQLLGYFINELNAFSDVHSHNLRIIKQAMERFYGQNANQRTSEIPKDDNLNALYEALSA